MNKQAQFAEKMEALDKVVAALKQTPWGEEFAKLLINVKVDAVLECVNTEEVEGVNRNYNMLAISTETDNGTELRIELSNYSMEKPNTTNFQTIGDVCCELFVGDQELDGDEGRNLLSLLESLISYTSDVLIKNTFGMTFEQFEASTGFLMDIDLHEFLLEADSDIREIKVAVDCDNQIFPEGCYFEMAAFVNVPKEIEPVTYIKENYSETNPLQFVPKFDSGFEEWLEENPISGLHEHWQEDFITPYGKAFNAMLTGKVMERIDNANIIASS